MLLAGIVPTYLLKGVIVSSFTTVLAESYATMVLTDLESA